MSNTTGYAALSHDRKMRERAIAIQNWLAAPSARLLIPRRKRGEVEALLAHLVERLTHVPAVEHLTFAPPLGWPVRLLKDSSFLRERHDATVGSIGIVVDHSHLSSGDTGVLVDWGSGVRVRCDLEELALEHNPATKSQRKSR